MRCAPVLTLIALLAFGCTDRPDPGDHPARLRPFDITFDWPTSPEDYGFLFAKAAGIYSNAGLDVRFHHSEGAPSVAEALGTGAIYAGTTTSDNLVRQIAQGAQFSRAVPILTYNPAVIASLEDSPISELRALEGHTFGMNRASSTYQQVLFLQDQGRIDLSKIQEYPIGTGGAEDLIERRADAVLAYRANVMVELETKGRRPHAIFLSSFGIYNYAKVLTFAGRAVLESAKVPDPAVDAFVDATLAGYRRCAQDINGCVKALIESDPTLNAATFLLGIQSIMRMSTMAAYPRSELDRWAVGGKVTENDRQAALALYRGSTN